MKRKDAIDVNNQIRILTLEASEQTASKVPEMYGIYPGDGSIVRAGTRIRWGSAIKKAAVDLWATAENNPDNAPDLWADLLYRNGIRVIVPPLTVTTAFGAGELGWWGDTLYRSKYAGNAYTPDEWAPNWEVVTDA